MTSVDKAMLLINELIIAEVILMKEENTRRNGSTKKANQRERDAAKALFQELTGAAPSGEQIERMVSL